MANPVRRADRMRTAPPRRKTSPLRFFRAWLILGLVMWLTVVILTLIPPTEAVPIAFDINDKFAHALAYAGLTAWFGLVLLGRYLLFIALGLLAQGVGLEFLQGLTMYRMFEVADMVANGVGVLAGALLMLTPLKRGLLWFEQLTGISRESQ